jgi:Zn-dependent membrane protease YugP
VQKVFSLLIYSKCWPLWVQIEVKTSNKKWVGIDQACWYQGVLRVDESFLGRNGMIFDFSALSCRMSWAM